MNKAWFGNFRRSERFLNGKRENYNFKAIDRTQVKFQECLAKDV
jgi:hypothetical protein